MFSFFRLSHSRIPAFIAILAILMLFIAPDVSTILEQRRSAEHHKTSVENIRSRLSEMAQHGMMDKMPTATDNAPCHAPAPAENGQHHTRSGGKLLEHFACGYCQLLVNLPLLLAIFLVVIHLLLLSARIPPPLNFPPYHFTFFPGLSQPRAPPVS
ncbi:conserved uncharacterized protein [Erwinia pyrifoliae Ep1/96]|uniref:DUF2946 domain-containing protein n=1 Tax=Erwinia pyrifoliae TaxID=79967 RepID=A0ABY5XDA7_ERWPY|nr:DUF2946 domain-containing protein [Erwinia pyrifoliae]MCT2387162.1 DUF2946 domain-containing protein [Erwinia pyrifoliae]MCU8587238.1 DUF2946 domain-containing protein [Erwinia pyrifoliae]UWS31099.1 DUF2946 domain-containing protein [Erwinia pyrifoliae]UWS35105.1 DUF2946 domain-containing protein [Erwinia pyrifoliae]UXK14086.1 DUF2946 domain-containing protein [Erwinia pyrifoliae]